jgi:pilus assembly protein Flp/PilA
MSKASIQAFLRDDSGATAIEYGLIAALVCIVIIAGITLVANGTTALFNNGAAEVLAEQTTRIP